MKIKPSDYKSILFFSLFAVLVSCSPSEKSSEAKNQTADTQTNQDSETPVYDDGWRKGTLRIEVDISQSGEQTEGTALHSQSESIIKAVSEEKVMLAPDLRPFVSSAPIKVEDTTQYQPFREIDPNADTIQSSQVNLTATWSVTSDSAKGDNQGSFVGKVNRVYLQSLHPSLFGPGYEVYLKINLTGKLKTKSVMSAPGQTAVVDENEKDTDQEITFNLYPVPNKEKLNDYQYLPPGMDEELKQRVIKQNIDLLAILNETYADSLAVQGDIGAGMKSEATEDKLTMTYEYNGNKKVGYAAIVGVSPGITKANKISIRISLAADK